MLNSRFKRFKRQIGHITHLAHRCPNPQAQIHSGVRVKQLCVAAFQAPPMPDSPWGLRMSHDSQAYYV